MSRLTGTASFPANFEPEISAPLDARELVSLRTNLIDPNIWMANDGNTYTYVGMKVIVTDDTVDNNGFYYLSALPFTVMNNWVRVSGDAGVGGSTGDVIISKDVFTGDNVTNTFVLSSIPAGERFVIVFVGGIPQFDFTLNLENIILNFTPNTGETIIVYTFTPCNVSITRDDFIGDGIETSYQLSQTPNAKEFVLAFVGGVIQTDYTVVNDFINFTTVPANTEDIWVYSMASPILTASIDEFVGDGITTDYMLSITDNCDKCLIPFVGGFPQVDFTYANNFLSFTIPPALGEPIIVFAYSTGTAPVVPSENSTVEFDIIGDGIATVFQFLHNKNTRRIKTEIYEDFGDYETIYTTISRPSVNDVRVTFGIPPVVGENYKLIVL